MNESTELKHRNKKLALKMAGIALGMTAFGFAMVPLYDVFCEITGLNGKTITVAEQGVRDVKEREVTIEFVAHVDRGMPWKFTPPVAKMKVKLGEMHQVNFGAVNLSNRHVVGQAVPSVSPGQAALYFNKTECFCFNNQPLDAHASADLGLAFFVDDQLPENIHTITLAYTLYNITEAVSDEKVAAN